MEVWDYTGGHGCFFFEKPARPVSMRNNYKLTQLFAKYTMATAGPVFL